MSDYEFNDESRPVMWLRGFPLYAAHVIALVFVVSLIATTVMMTAHADGLMRAMAFSSTAVLNGEVWRVITYGLLNPPTNLWFVVDMFIIVWFGRELEKSFGRRRFLIFYAVLYLMAPLLLTVGGLWRPQSLAGQTGSFGLFIAFATLYPNVAFFLNVLLKWVATILVAMYALMAVSQRDKTALILLAATTGFAFAFVRFQQGRLEMPKLSIKKKAPELRVLPGGAKPKSGGEAAVPPASMAEIDALLDKIAQSGMGSLTPKERAKLEAARADLIKRDSSRRP